MAGRAHNKKGLTGRITLRWVNPAEFPENPRELCGSKSN
jgi:hypothetical protein